MELNDANLKKIKRLIVFTVVVVLLGANWRHILEFFKWLFAMARPFILGAGMAFVLNVLMRGIEKRLSRIKKPRLRRAASITLALLFVLLLLVFVIGVVTPQLTQSILSLKDKIPPFMKSAGDILQVYFDNNPELLMSLNSITIDWEELFRRAQEYLSQGLGNFVTGSVGAVAGFAGAVANFFIGLFFAVYLLAGKETLKSQTERTLTAFLPEKRYQALLYAARLAERKFSGFITGQCLEACILGAMFVLTLTVLRLPYAVLIGVLVAFTALIPVFGAFIGAFIGAFLMLIQSPADAVLFIVIFLLLQQIEGNLIYPHVVGGSVELPAIWVLVAVTLGGSMFGILGMIVFIPLFSVFYTLMREKVHEELRKKEKSTKKEEKPAEKSAK